MKNTDAEKKICSFLEKKRAIFSQYLSVTNKVKEVIENKDEKNIERLLAKRQDCIHKINKIDGSIEKIVRESAIQIQYISVKIKGLIDSHVKRIKNIMETVAPLDREILVMVKEECEEIKTDLLMRQNVRQAVRGYRNDIKDTPRFLDTRK